MQEEVRFRAATTDDIVRLRTLIDESVRALQPGDYSQAQIEGALQGTLGVDSQLLDDGTWYVVELPGAAAGTPLIAAGGWSRRKTLCGGDGISDRDSGFLDPAKDFAKIRAFYVHPDWARKGIGTRLLEHCENAARAAGFHRFEMGATLTGVPLYRKYGYIETSRFTTPLPNGEALEIVRMEKCDAGYELRRDTSGPFSH
ncbi:GNAT family N-acetyltransferase [Silvibacterium acidisoli]|uniref:GNAT family N-acetyltransferase n=1 Tax=Acidobacteriaceae bacterium ZG23-2 TaxID=2883246 RepID=UPI00406C56C9